MGMRAPILRGRRTRDWSKPGRGRRRVTPRRTRFRALALVQVLLALAAGAAGSRPATAAQRAGTSSPASATAGAAPTALASLYGQALADACVTSRLASVGLPEREIDLAESQGAHHRVSEADIRALAAALKEWESALALNHHGDHLAEARKSAVEADRLTRALFGDAHLFASLSAACVAPLARSDSGVSWYDHGEAAIGESEAAIRTRILRLRSERLRASDPLLLLARYDVARTTDGAEAAAQFDALARDLDVDLAKVEAGTVSAKPLLTILRAAIAAQPEASDTLIVRFLRIARAQAIGGKETPEDWRGGKTGFNAYVGSTPAEVAAEERNVRVLEAVYGSTDAVLAEPLFDLGQRYRGAGRLAQARATETRALATVRAKSVLPDTGWTGSENDLAGYVESELGTIDELEHQYDAADRHYTSCMRMRAKEDASYCLQELERLLGDLADKRGYDAYDLRMGQVRRLIDTVLGPDDNSWYSFGQAWARTYLLRGDYARQAEQLRELIRRRPDVREFREALIKSYLAMNRPDLAEATLTQSLLASDYDRQDKDWTYQQLLGLFDAQGKTAAAEDLVKAAVKRVDPDGSVLAKGVRFTSAESIYTRRVQDLLSSGEVKAARVLLDAMMRPDPEYQPTWLIVDVLEAENRFAEAEPLVTTSLAELTRGRDSPDAATDVQDVKDRLAQLRLQQDQPVPALALYESVTRAVDADTSQKGTLRALVFHHRYGVALWRAGTARRSEGAVRAGVRQSGGAGARRCAHRCRGRQRQRGVDELGVPPSGNGELGGDARRARSAHRRLSGRPARHPFECGERLGAAGRARERRSGRGGVDRCKTGAVDGPSVPSCRARWRNCKPRRDRTRAQSRRWRSSLPDRKTWGDSSTPPEWSWSDRRRATSTCAGPIP